MKIFKKICPVILMGLAVLFTYHSSISFAKEIPIDILAKIQKFSNVRISPDGNFIASFRPLKGKAYLVIESIDPAIKKITAVYNPAKATVSSFMWLNNDRLAVSVYFNKVWRGAPYREWRLLAIGKDGKKAINLSKEKDSGRGAPANLGNIVSILPQENDHILVEKHGEVYKVNIYTGKIKKEVRRVSHIGSWYADHEGNVRLGYGGVGTSVKMVMRSKDDGPWKTMDRFDSISGHAEYNVIGFSREDKNIIYVGTELGGVPYAYYEYDLAKKEYIGKLFGKDKIPANGMIIDPYTGDIDGYRYREHETKVHYVNKRLASIQRFLDKQFPDTNNYIVDYDRSKTRFIISITGPQYAGELMFFDIKTKQMMVISELYEGLDLNDLSDMVPVSYKARDGLEIPGYLSLPLGKEPKNLPTVILPHGGPASRDSRGFDQWVQFLTSRGYAVLQMNYRGSTGYGNDFLDKGDQQWGRAMQDDITDGTKWMIEQGYSDPARICIMGGSYGGYSALNGITREPDLYKCAVSLAGIGDMKLFFRQESKFASFNTYKKYIKNPNHSITDVSPAHHIDKIKAPILLFHGDKDSRVPFQQSKLFYKQLKRAGKDVAYFELKDEVHQMKLEKNKLIFLRETEKFLKKHLN